MPQDFLGPSQMMAQQLQGIVQSAATHAETTRANQLLKHQQMQDMLKGVETNLALSQKLHTMNKPLAHKLFNEALAPFNRSVTFEEFDIASQMFQQADEYYRNNDLQGMQMVLKQAEPFLLNITDQQKALDLQRVAQRGLAGQQAEAIQHMQSDPGLARANEAVSMLKMVDGNIEQLAESERLRLTGSTDLTEQRNRFAMDQAIVEGHERKTKALSTLFTLDPTAFGKASEATARAIANPEVMAQGRIAELLAKPERSSEEERELLAKVSTYGNPTLQAASGLKTAQLERERVQRQLEDTTTRLAALDGHLAIEAEAAGKVSSLDEAAKGLPDQSTPLPDGPAAAHLLTHGTREAERQAYLLKTQPVVAGLEQTVQQVDQQRHSLAQRLAVALPGQREAIQTQLSELDAMSRANSALVRVLKDENSYELSTRRAALDLMTDPAERATAEKAVETLESQRAADLKIIEGERARLLRRQTLLQGRIPAAERKEEEERNLRHAHMMVDRIVHDGGSLSVAVREAADQFHVNKQELAKQVKEARGLGVQEAQMALLEAVQSSRRVNRREPDHTELNRMLLGVLRTHPGVKGEDVLSVLKDPNKPMVSIDNRQETASAKKIGEGLGEEYIALQKSAVSASQQISKLDRMEQLLKGVETGALIPTLTQIQAIGQSLGFKVDGSLSTKQALNALSNELALTLRNPTGGAGMPGALSDPDREFLVSMTPGLGKTPEGNQLIIDTARKLAQRSQEVAKLARAYKKAHGGSFDDGFFDDLQSYADAHPLFAGVTLPTAAPQGQAAPYKDPEKERRYQEWKSRQAQ